MVYRTEEKQNVVLHSRPAASQQSDHSERRDRTDHRRVRGGLRRKVDLLGAHMVNAMNKVLRDCIPDITMPFLDDIPIKGCPVEEKDETIGPDGCRKFVSTHIDDCEKVPQRLEGARLTFFGEKSAFGQSEIMVVGHLRGPYDRKPSLAKVEAISAMKHDYNSVTEVRRFLGACALSCLLAPDRCVSRVGTAEVLD